MEHEISIISALQMMQAADTLKYELLPVYIAGSGRWYTGSGLLDRTFYKRLPACLSELTAVTLLPIPGMGGLVELRQGNSFEPGPVIPVDVFFPCLHGTLGEDGALQGLFEMADVVYTGCDIISAAIGMSKYHCKKFLQSQDIPVLPAALVSKEEIMHSAGFDLPLVRERIRKTAGLDQFPLFVKPASLGSSIGISKVADEHQLNAALVEVFKYDTQALVEPCLQNKLEINVSVYGYRTAATVSVVETPISSGGELTYADKYLREAPSKNGESRGMESLSRLIDPDGIETELKNLARSYALKAYRYIGCSGVARIDFMVDLDNNAIFFNEINTLPGSLAFYLWAHSNPCLLYTDLIDALIDQALHRKAARLSVKRGIGFAALFS